MNKFWLIATHEFLKHLQRKSFLVSMMLLPVMVVAGMLFANTFANTAERHLEQSSKDISEQQKENAQQNKPAVIGYVDHAGVIVARSTDLITTTIFREFADETAAKQAVETHDIEAYYVLPADYLKTNNVVRYARQIQFTADDSSAFALILRASLLNHLDKRVSLRFNNILTFNTIRLDKDGQPVAGRFATIDLTNDDTKILFVPLFFAVFLYISIFASSGLLQHSVVEEKENRMMELLLTSLRPSELLGGKIVGLGALGLIQMFVLIAAGLFALRFQSFHLEFLQNFDVPLYVWILAFPYYLLGYLVYGGLMAGIGATLNSTRESSALTSLLMLPIMTPFFLMLPILDKPNGWVAVLLSIIPYTSSITMMIRLTMVDVGWWQIALSLLLLVGSVFLSIWAGARLFRATMLLHGKKLSVREVFRAVRARSSSGK